MPTAQSLAQYPLLANAPVSTSPYEMAQNMYGIIKQHYAKLPKPHVIMFVGPPASGKTSLYRNVFPDYVWVNQDTLKTLPAVLKSITAALNSGKNVVVDRTHGTVDARLKVMEVIKPRVPAVPVHVLQLDVPKELSIRMNLVRAHVSKGQGTAVPTIVFHTYYKSFEPPQEKEGFASIEKLPWYVLDPHHGSFLNSHTRHRCRSGIVFSHFTSLVLLSYAGFPTCLSGTATTTSPSSPPHSPCLRLQ